jgi:hypothetical protein
MAKVLIIGVGSVLIVLLAWTLMYPAPNDPRNMKYVLWKTGIVREEPQGATDAMVGDENRDKLVIGKTEAKIRDRFGSLLSPTQVSPYLRSCYQKSAWKDDKDSLFIAQSSWMIIFNGKRATKLILLKGC